MAKFIPSGFNPAAVEAGIHKAMGFGEPTRTEDKAWFYFPTGRVVTDPADQDNVPFDPSATVTPNPATPRKIQQACAIEFIDKQAAVETFGDVKASRIKITLMDVDYQKVKGFAYVVAGGDKYLYDFTEPPVALGSIDFWTVWCNAEGER